MCFLSCVYSGMSLTLVKEQRFITIRFCFVLFFVVVVVVVVVVVFYAWRRKSATAGE